MAMKLAIRIGKRRSSVHYAPGLHWNQYTHDVWHATDALREAVRRCQATAHDPNYRGKEE